MHAFMHYHVTKYAQWSRKIIQISSIKGQFYIMFPTFLFFLKQCTTNFSKFSSFKLMHLSDCTFLNIENDRSTSQEVAGSYLSEENLGKSESILNFIGRMGITNSSVTKKTGKVESPKLYFLLISPFSLIHIILMRKHR